MTLTTDSTTVRAIISYHIISYHIISYLYCDVMCEVNYNSRSRTSYVRNYFYSRIQGLKRGFSSPARRVRLAAGRVQTAEWTR